MTSGIQDVLDEVDASLAAGAGDDSSGIGSILATVNKARNNVRGTMLSKCQGQLMRTAKLWRRRMDRVPRITDAMGAAITRCNWRHAVRSCDVINIDGKAAASAAARGRGAHKRWTAPAILRCCFGVASFASGGRPSSGKGWVKFAGVGRQRVEGRGCRGGVLTSRALQFERIAGLGLAFGT
jgi:hypothetical protein